MQKDNFYPFYRRFYKAKSESSENDTADRIKTLRDIIYDEDGGDSFIKWLGELRDNNRSFQAVRTDDITSPQGQITTYGFSPKTDNPVFNGTEKLSKVNMSDYFLAINNEYRKTLKQKDQIDTVAKFLNICHKGIIEVNSK